MKSETVLIETVHPGSTKFLKDRDLFHFYAMIPQDVFYQLRCVSTLLPLSISLLCISLTI